MPTKKLKLWKQKDPSDKLEEVHLEYKGAKVYAYLRLEWEDVNGKEKQVRKYYCHLYRGDRFLNLGEMSDGSKFTAVAQAVNEAKWLVDYELERKLDNELLSLGFLREDLFQYNRLRITERLEVKEKLLLDKDLLELKSKGKKEREDLDLKEKFDMFLPAFEKEFNETVKVLIVGRFVVTKFNDKIQSFLY